MKLHDNPHRLTDGEISVLRDAGEIISSLHKDNMITMTAVEVTDLRTALEKLEGMDQ